MRNTTLYYFLRSLWVRYRMVTRPDSYLRRTGFIKSHIHIKPLDEQGQPVPWLNYSMVEFISERLKPGMRIFEYGAGYSTLYFKSRVAFISSVEYDAQWYVLLQKQVAHLPHIQLTHCAVGPEYTEKALQAESPFDLILIDGRERLACLQVAFKALTANGVILFDDTEREAYRPAFELAAKAGFKALTISGLKPFSFGREQSTIFYRKENVLAI